MFSRWEILHQVLLVVEDLPPKLHPAGSRTRPEGSVSAHPALHRDVDDHVLTVFFLEVNVTKP